MNTLTDAKPFWQSKTFWLNAISIVLAILPLLAADPVIATIIPTTIILLVSSILNIFLRFLGGSPLSTRKATPIQVAPVTKELEPVKKKSQHKTKKDKAV